MDNRRTVNRRRATAIGCGALCVVVAITAVLLARSPSSPTKRSPTNHLAAPLRTPTPATSSQRPTPVPTPASKPLVPHDTVASAAPTSFVMSGSGFTIKATVCGMAYVRPLDPPGDQHHTVCWVQHDFGFAPGSKARGTTYLLGHAWGQDRLEVLNKLSETAMRQVLPQRHQGRTADVGGVATYPVTALDGYLVRLRTATGLLTYTVRNAYAVGKAQAGNIAPLMADHTRNRVVIITCGELNHVDYDYNIIVEAYLTSSVATRADT